MAADAGHSHRRVVVMGIDDSEFSEYAFDFYLKNFQKSCDYLVLVHVSEYSSIIHTIYLSNVCRKDDYIILVMVPEYGTVIASPGILTDPIVVTELIKEEEHKMQTLIKKYSSKMKDAHLGGKVKQMTGKVGESIVAAAKEEDAAMIVMGTRGMGKVRRTFIGSVSDYVIHHSHVPVLVCRHKDHHKHDHHDHH